MNKKCCLEAAKVIEGYQIKFSNLEKEKDDQYQAFQKWKKEYFKDLEIEKSLCDRLAEGIVVWLHSYASEFCDPKRVKESGDKVTKGTLSFIAELLAEYRERRKEGK